jgi:glucokinase
LLRSGNIELSQLLGVALGINAVSIGDTTLSSSVLPWVNDGIEAMFAEALGVPVRLSIRPSTLANYRKLPEPAPRSMIFLHVGDGVSAHGIEGDQLLRGRYGLAGELGHVTAEPNGMLCGCGRRGCLETLCGGPFIHRQMIKGLQRGVVSPLDAKTLAAASPPEAIELMWQAWLAGDSFSRTIMEDVFDRLAWGVGLVVNLVDPDLIVVGGYVLHGHRQWAQEVERRAERWVLHAGRRSVSLVPALATTEDELRTIACNLAYAAAVDELFTANLGRRRKSKRLTRSND